MLWGDGASTNVVTAGASQDTSDFSLLSLDAESNTEHAPYRNYSPTLGLWLSPDPDDNSYNFTNPQSFNRYAYVLNNPLSLSDPSGLDECSDDGDCVSENAPGSWDCDEYGNCITTQSSGNGDPVLLPSNDPNRGIGNPCDGPTDPACNSAVVNLGFSDILSWVTPGGIASSSSTQDSKPIIGQFFGTHYCGPGGSGDPVNSLDAACQAHDQCYNRNSLTPMSNFNLNLPFQQASALQACNAALCSAASKSNDLGATRVQLYFTLVPTVGYCSATR